MTSLYRDAIDMYGDQNVYSQFGEEAVLRRILDLIGVRSKVCVEFGAADGLSCSNTARLWRDEGWKALLIEPDHERYEQLEGNAGPFDTICRRAFVTPSGPLSIAALLAQHELHDVDVLSLDVDGDDLLIFAALSCRPRVICVEFNPTIPPHLDVRPTALGQTMGASALALVRAGESVGYRFIGATYCNAVFVVEEEAGPFENYETDLGALFPREQYTYAITDFQGRVVLVGEAMPWQPKVPYVRPFACERPVTHVSTNPQELRRGFESIWGPAAWVPAAALSPGNLNDVLAGRPQLVCVDLTMVPVLNEVEWIREAATGAGYHVLQSDRVMGLISKEAAAR